jgi:hypothetical protein
MKLDTPVIVDRIKEIIAERIGLDVEREDIADDIAGKNNDRKLNNKHGYPRQC